MHGGAHDDTVNGKGFVCVRTRKAIGFIGVDALRAAPTLVVAVG